MKLSKVLLIVALVLCFATASMAQVFQGPHIYNSWDSDWPNSNGLASGNNLDIQNTTATTFSGKLDEGGGPWVEWDIVNGTYNPTTSEFTFSAVVADPAGAMTINFAGLYGFGFVIEINSGAGPNVNGQNGVGVYMAAPGQTGWLGTYTFMNVVTKWENGVATQVKEFYNPINYLTIDNVGANSWSGMYTFGIYGGWQAPVSGTFDANGNLAFTAFGNTHTGIYGNGFVGWWDWSQGGQTGQGGFIAPAVPEPSTVTAMLTGLGSVGFFAFRRRK
ncbi:MAG: PEP-CTERM sorting domain-containing protein [Armatimonadota bacterium]